ncbi:hypothetical protein C5612_21690 [Pseudomonas frederiksbergensis]|uniref:Delta-60 repeat domain-containing protein n=1 Tax=Pseudomonas frederiksbergensis TaxID=104087 RepID=A0A2S8HDR8_9PSED|nr:hypothetical protein [Pseudomonas frederiksbergensis]PQP00573.1 hypothetical protein C5612_21690 [Pseudomonas frederiksbergensis]
MANQNSSTVNPGDLDPAFAGDGSFDVPSGTGSVRSIVADGQGGFFLVAWVSRECWLYHIFQDGTQDLQFGQNGVSKWAFASGVDSLPVQLLMQPDGKIILIGLLGEDMSNRQPAFTRFNRNGSPDLIFENHILPDRDVSGPSGCVQADGKILLLAHRFKDGDTEKEETLLHRFEPNGDTDHRFGDSGSIIVQFNDQKSKGVSVAVMDDGKILVGGTVQRENSIPTKALARYFPLGGRDSSFGQSGYWESTSNNGMRKVIVHENNIFCVGYFGTPFRASISKITGDGAYDPSFNDGKTLTVDIPADFPGYFVDCRSVAVQSDGCIVAGGNAGRTTKAFWLRVLPKGNLDRGFGDNGIARHDQDSYLFDLIVTNQRILAAVDAGAPRSPKIFGIQS